MVYLRVGTWVGSTVTANLIHVAVRVRFTPLSRCISQVSLAPRHCRCVPAQNASAEWPAAYPLLPNHETHINCMVPYFPCCHSLPVQNASADGPAAYLLLDVIDRNIRFLESQALMEA